MHIEQNDDFKALFDMAFTMTKRVPEYVWEGRLESHFTAVHKILDAVSGGEYDTDVILNEAFELTNIINSLRTGYRDNQTKRAVQAETLEMSAARLITMGLYCFYDSTFVHELHHIDRNSYITAVRRMLAHFVAGIHVKVKNRDGLSDLPVWGSIRCHYGRVLRTFYPFLHSNSPWVMFKNFIATEGEGFCESTKTWGDGTPYIKALFFTKVYEEFSRVEVLTKDTTLEVSARVYRQERETLIDFYAEQM